jgi:cyanate permease
MPPTPGNRRFVIEALLFLTYAAFGVSWLALSPLTTDLMGFFQVTKREFSFVNTAVTIAKVIAPIVTGAVAIRLGLKRTILVGSLFICAALVSPLLPSFPVFLASRFLFGVGGAVVVTLTGPMVMQWFPRDELPLVNALNGVAVNSGIAVAMFLTARVAGTSLGWRGTLLLFGSVNAALFVAWALLGRDREAPPKKAGEAPDAPVGYRDVWRIRETWLCTLAFTGGVAVYLGFSYWLPTYYETELHFAKVAAGQYSGTVNLVGIPSAVVFGLLTRRLGVRRPFVIVGGILSGTAAFGMFLSSSPAVIFASALVLGVSLFIPTGAVVTAMMEAPGVTPRHMSLMMGTMFSFCYMVCSFLPTYVMALIRDATGSFVPGFVVLTVFSWVIVGAGLMLRETGPGRQAARA